MPRVSKVSWPKMGIDYGFMFHIKTQEELWDYWTVSRSGSIQRGVAEALEASRKNGHVSSADGSLVYMRLQFGDSLLNAGDVFIAVLEGMKQSLREDGEIFVNTNGGYFSFQEGMILADTRMVDAYVLPTIDKPTIVVSRWPNGTHWYARVDGQDVELDGSRKWLSERGAHEAAVEWLKQLREETR
jgi:hypothetical protein